MEQPPVRFADQKTILVVDDDAAILRAVRAILAKNNHYNILTATAGADALNQSINFKGDIHLLLSDFQMPESALLARRRRNNLPATPARA